MPVITAVVGDDAGAELDEPGDLVVTPALGTQVDVDAVLRGLVFGYALEQQAWLTLAERAARLGVSGVVIGMGRHRKRRAPPAGERVGVGAVDRDAPDGKPHVEPFSWKEGVPRWGRQQMLPPHEVNANRRGRRDRRYPITAAPVPWFGVDSDSL